MSSLSPNPLSKHFRQPVLYIKLPSNGEWYPNNTLDLPVNGEVPIYAMTARDEITMKTPDALLNGASTVHVIESCCPAIKDAWKMPAVDIDAVLLAIRLATYGKEMEFVSACPHCGQDHEQAVDISVILSKIGPVDYSKTVQADGLEITLRPQSYEDYNKNNMLNFQEQQILKVVQDESFSEEEKTKQFDELFQRLIETGISQVGKSIASIKLDDGTVVDNREFIYEFLDKCDKNIWDAIKNEIERIKSSVTYNQLNLVCTNAECGQEFTTPFVFEQTNFFG